MTFFSFFSVKIMFKNVFQLLFFSTGMADGHGATGLLVQNYGADLSQTETMRTPLSVNTIMTEAMDAHTRITGATPLLGGDSGTLHHTDGPKSAMPQSSLAATPNVLAAQARAIGGKTPLPG